MKIDIKSLILGIGIFFLIAAASEQLVVVKPLKPDNTIVLYDYKDQLKTRMEGFIKLGYVVKSTACANYNCLVVMEHY